MYALFGVGALIFELLMFWYLAEVIDLYLILANFIAVATGMFVSFGLNAIFNYKLRDNLIGRFARYSMVIAVGYLVSSTLLLVFTNLGVQPLVAKIITLPFIFLLQYGLNSNFTFYNKREVV